MNTGKADKRRVRIVEMAARDGLQNESRFVPTADKIRLIDLISTCGFDTIEVTSFVSPKWVPQLADASQVMAGIRRRPGVAYTALTPNLKGYAAARAAGADGVAVFASASEGFSRANINCSVAESLERFAPVLEAARLDGMPVRGYISCATHCPYDGQVEPGAVAGVARALWQMGCSEIVPSDTIGQAMPEDIAAMLRVVLDEVPAEKLAGHYHDTKGHALDNIEASLELGLRVFDGAVGGLGGCPYAPGAKGNVDTLLVQEMMQRLGYETGLDAECLRTAAQLARSLAKGAG